MSDVLSTYSFRDVNVSFSNTNLGIAILFGGGSTQGVNEITVRMSTDRTTEKVGADGSVMPSAIPGDNGEVEIQVLQTSVAHQQFLNWFNQLITLSLSGNVDNWATTKCFIQLITNGTSHNCSGVSPVKMPDIPYAAEGGTINWVFRCANIYNS